MKKRLFLISIFLVFSLLLFGCGTKEEQAQVNKEEKLRVAALLPGSINDHGFNATCYRGLKLIEEKYGAEISYTENVPQSDMEEVFRGYATEGYDIIFGHGFEFADPAKKVASEFLDVKFVINSTNAFQEPNVASLNTNNLEQGFLQGVVAGLLTKSNVVGGIGGMEIPPSIDSTTGFRLGAKYVNENVNAMTTFVGSFDDAAKAKELALAMIEQGADIIMMDADMASIGGYEAVVEKGVLAVGSDGDQHELAPDNIVTSCFDDLAFAMEIFMEDYVQEKFEAKFYDLGVKEGAVYLAPWHNFEDKISQDVKDELAKIIEDLKNDKIDVSKLREQESQ